MSLEMETSSHTNFATPKYLFLKRCMSLSIHILKVIIFISHGYFTVVDVEVVVQSISYGDNIYYKYFSTAFGSGRKKIARSKMESPSIMRIPAFFKALCTEDRAQRLEEKEEVAREREEKRKTKAGSSARSIYAERGLDDDDDEKDDDINEAIFESGEIFRPENPFYMMKKISKRSELYVPHDVVKKFDLKLPNKVNIRDEGERTWKSKVHVWKDGRTWISKRWRAFCKWNNVLPDDRCICEFVPATEQTDTFLKVRIVRA